MHNIHVLQCNFGGANVCWIYLHTRWQLSLALHTLPKQGHRQLHPMANVVTECCCHCELSIQKEGGLVIAPLNWNSARQKWSLNSMLGCTQRASKISVFCCKRVLRPTENFNIKGRKWACLHFCVHTLIACSLSLSGKTRDLFCPYQYEWWCNLTSKPIVSLFPSLPTGNPNWWKNAGHAPLQSVQHTCCLLPVRVHVIVISYTSLGGSFDERSRADYTYPCHLGWNLFMYFLSCNTAVLWFTEHHLYKKW